MNNSGIILTLAYPDTIVMISEELPGRTVFTLLERTVFHLSYFGQKSTTAVLPVLYTYIYIYIYIISYIYIYIYDIIYHIHCIYSIYILYIRYRLYISVHIIVYC